MVYPLSFKGFLFRHQGQGIFYLGTPQTPLMEGNSSFRSFGGTRSATPKPKPEATRLTVNQGHGLNPSPKADAPRLNRNPNPKGPHTHIVLWPEYMKKSRNPAKVPPKAVFLAGTTSPEHRNLESCS